MPETTNRRGPKPSGKALSGAERQRRYIARLKENAVTDAVSNNTVTDELAAAHARIAELERIAANLRQINSAQADQLTTMDNKLRKAEWAHKREANCLTRERDEARAELAAIKALPTRPAPKQNLVTDRKPERGYPEAVKCLAVEMLADGKATSDIRQAILQSCGKAPDTSNLTRLIRGWRDAGKAA